MPAQARRPLPLDAAPARARPGRPGPAAAARHRAAGLPRAQPGRSAALRRPALAWRADLDGLRGERDERDRGQADDQEAADALEQSDRAALPRRPHGGAERHARGRLPATLSGLPARERWSDAASRGMIAPTILHTLGAAGPPAAKGRVRGGFAKPNDLALTSRSFCGR